MIGKQHHELLNWLIQDWPSSRQRVCVIQGFPGVGKTILLDRWPDDSGSRLVRVELPDQDDLTLDEAVLTIDGAVTALNMPSLVAAGGTTPDMLNRLETVLRQPVILAVDEFQNLLLPDTGRPDKPLQALIQRLGRQTALPGRLLLLTNRSIERERWSERCIVKTLDKLDDEDALAFLAQELAETDRSDEVPESRRRDVIRWLGGNPRAIRLFRSCIELESLDDLIGVSPESWELRDQDVSQSLLRKLERQLLERAMQHLSPPADVLLRRLSVLRLSVKQDGLKWMTPQGEDSGALRDALIARFMIEHKSGWYSVHPIAREILQRRLSEQAQLFRQAHAMAGELYARHFKAKTIQETAALGGQFVEARYHLTRSGREDDLADLAKRFGAHIQASISATSRMPETARELDERIALLSGLLDGGGPKGLEYHLAQLLHHRGRPDDRGRALEHARRATGQAAPPEAWLFRARLVQEVAGTDQALIVLRAGIDCVPPDKNLFALYQAAGELLAKDGRTGAAVELLRQGIDRVPPDKSVVALYQAAGDLLAKDGRTGEAVELLRQGIDRVPPENDVRSLYQAAGDLLAKDGRTGAAVELLRQGIARVPPDKGLPILYQAASAVTWAANRPDESMAILREGIGRIPVGKWNRPRLCVAALLLALNERNAEGLQDLLRGTGAAALEAPNMALGLAFVKQMAFDWAGAAGDLAQARTRSERVADLALHEAFSWLCANEPRRARAAFDGFGGEIRLDAGSSAAWLDAFIALRCGEPERARRALGSFLERDLVGNETPTEQWLVALWDTGVIRLGTAAPAYYFPTLPPSLTGLDHPVTRTAHGGPILPAAMPAPDPPTTLGCVMNDKPTDSARPRTVLAVATEWHSRHGGLSTFNRELCRALAAAGCKVFCLVPRIAEDEAAAAASAGVTLIAAPPIPGSDDSALLMLPAKLPDDARIDIVIGHDRITGPAALAQADQINPRPRRIQFIHTAPGEIEWFKDHSTGPGAAVVGEKRQIIQAELACGADLVAAVGPLLREEIATELHSKGGIQVFEFNPGLPEIERVTEPAAMPQCLLLGRAEDFELKGFDIAARAMSLVSLPGSLPLDPVLLIRGAQPGSGNDLQKRLRQIAGKPALRIRVREYTADADRVIDDIRRASVVLMPSRTEGFGLVGLEAIAAGVPVLLSERSGLARLLRRIAPCNEVDLAILPVDDDLEADATAWSRQIEFVLQDRDAAFRRAAKLRETLAARLSWDRSINDLLSFDAESLSPVAA